MRDTVAYTSRDEFHMATLVHDKPYLRSLSKKAQPAAEPALSQRKRDRPGKQQALLQAALQLFASKGFDATTTREIAAAAGCAEGLIHRYFDGKAGLLGALVDQHVSEALGDSGPQMRPALQFEDEFVSMVDRAVERMWQSREFLKAFIPRAIVDPALSNVMNRAVLSGRNTAVAERLRRYPKYAALPAEDIEVLAQSVAILGLIFGFMRPVVLRQDREVARSAASKFAKVLTRAATSAKTGQPDPELSGE
jgi:AcrR family transcriptional regulator